MAKGTAWETIRGQGGQLVDEVKRLIHEGNVRRVVVRQKDRVVAEFPADGGCRRRPGGAGRGGDRGPGGAAHGLPPRRGARDRGAAGAQARPAQGDGARGSGSKKAR